VSATPASIYLNEDKPINILKIPLDCDYYGFDTDLPLSRRIVHKNMDVSNDKNTCRTILDISPDIMFIIGTAMINYENISNKHIILSTTLGRNKDLDTAAIDIIENFKYSDKALIVLIAYASFEDHGTKIIGNNEAYHILNFVDSANKMMTVNRAIYQKRMKRKVRAFEEVDNKIMIDTSKDIDT